MSQNGASADGWKSAGGGRMAAEIGFVWRGLRVGRLGGDRLVLGFEDGEESEELGAGHKSRRPSGGKWLKGSGWVRHGFVFGEVSGVVS
jgi:hypothetical protein